ncbi:MAG TPA: aminotransferase class V-fold PLP-dependent enzyme [Candidatus Limnocylindrales bacterium]|nr:aminotransferase class V-fold PLP-dependent enzyme [Candidatus Limnocylindrales bacterium]
MTKELNLYFDNASTSWPKPESVYGAPERQMRQVYGNPGRTGHTRTLEADRLIYRTREALANLFHAPDPGRIVFTLNATDALNMAIKGLVEPGDHILFTAMEHNSVLRPLGGLRKAGSISTTAIPCSPEGYPDLDCLEKLYQSRSRLLIINHASNVIGTITPLNEMIASAHRHGVYVLVDAAQTAGVIPIDVTSAEIDLLAFTGHKSLLGPSGTGGLYVRNGIDLKPWREGGTGNYSETDHHPSGMPERLEAGTLNSPGLAGLLAGVTFIQETGMAAIRNHETVIRAYLHNKLQAVPGITIYGPSASSCCTAALSFNLAGTDNGAIGHILESSFGILCRTGLHCAPLAHKAISTFPQGTVRLSPGFFTSTADVDYLVEAVAEIARLATS